MICYNITVLFVIIFFVIIIVISIITHTLFFISNTFISNAKLKLLKNQAKAKQHPDAELSLFENYSLFSFTLSSRNNMRYTKNVQKKKYVCLNEAI